ncbi:TPA: tetratricopeptide repeat protein [Acinetobacter baumannii]
MGTRMTGMVFPFNGSKEDIQGIIYKWMQHEAILLDRYKEIHVNFLDNNFIFIANADIFESAYNNPELWQELLLESLIQNWVVFFECIDSWDQYSYLIYKNNIEIRRVIQIQESDLYQEGEPLFFEKEWLDFTTYYEKENYKNGQIEIEKIVDPIFLEETDDYNKYYYVCSKNQHVYHCYLARLMLSELFINYLGINIIDDKYIIKDEIIINYDEIPMFEKVLKFAKNGDIDSQNKIGKMYQQGYGIEKNYALAFYWYQQAANQQDSFGQLNVGMSYLNGLGVKQDIDTALLWLNRSIAQDNPDALITLAEMYENGKFLEKSIEQAISFYKKAVKQGSGVAAYRLGLIYEYGKDTVVDIKMAKRWYYQAVNNFNEDAKKRLDELNNMESS